MSRDVISALKMSQRLSAEVDALGESPRHGPLRRYLSAGRAWPELYAICRVALAPPGEIMLKLKIWP
jgi:hypothetical protein